MSTQSLGSWVARGACRGSDATVFFPLSGDTESARRAKSICARCEVAEACRGYALGRPGERGIWGGMTEAERNRWRRARRAGQAA